MHKGEDFKRVRNGMHAHPEVPENCLWKVERIRSHHSERGKEWEQNSMFSTEVLCEVPIKLNLPWTITFEPRTDRDTLKQEGYGKRRMDVLNLSYIGGFHHTWMFQSFKVVINCCPRVFVSVSLECGVFWDFNFERQPPQLTEQRNGLLKLLSS